MNLEINAEAYNHRPRYFIEVHSKIKIVTHSTSLPRLFLLSTYTLVHMVQYSLGISFLFIHHSDIINEMIEHLSRVSRQGHMKFKHVEISEGVLF